MNFLFGDNRIYFDYASTTPVSSRVKRAMEPFWSRFFHNPNGLHRGSVHNHTRLEKARVSIARIFSVHSSEVIFTSGGTESDNLALFGVLFAYKQKNQSGLPHIIISSIEHPAVLEVARFLESSGEARISYLSVDSRGVVSVEELRSLLTPETILVSVMYVNNEVGTIQPISEIVKSIRHYKKHTLRNIESVYPLVHTDASQAILYEELSFEKLGIDLLSCNGGKIYGPKGVGLLIKKNRVPLASMMHGGNQEFGLRPGTHALPLIVGLEEALQESVALKKSEGIRLSKLHDYLVKELLHRFPDVSIHGSLGFKIPGILSISYPHIDSDLLVLELDALGIELSSKTACKYDDPNESYVLSAMGHSEQEGEQGTVRISLGRSTNYSDIRVLLKSFEKIFKKYRLFQESLNKNKK